APRSLPSVAPGCPCPSRHASQPESRRGRRRARCRPGARTRTRCARSGGAPRPSAPARRTGARCPSAPTACLSSSPFSGRPFPWCLPGSGPGPTFATWPPLRSPRCAFPAADGNRCRPLCRPAVERNREHLVDRVDRDELELAPGLGRKLVEVGLVLARDHDALQSRALSCEHLLAYTADRQDLAREGDLAGHADVVAHPDAAHE